MNLNKNMNDTFATPNPISSTGPTSDKCKARSRMNAQKWAHLAGSGAGRGLTQVEVATILGMTERAVREIERRALWKLRHHPWLKELWDEYVSGELEEDSWNLNPAEIEALFHAARNAEELRVLQKVLRMIGW